VSKLPGHAAITTARSLYGNRRQQYQVGAYAQVA
jgi:hypothetical protein